MSSVLLRNIKATHPRQPIQGNLIQP